MILVFNGCLKRTWLVLHFTGCFYLPTWNRQLRCHLPKIWCGCLREDMVCKKTCGVQRPLISMIFLVKKTCSFSRDFWSRIPANYLVFMVFGFHWLRLGDSSLLLKIASFSVPKNTMIHTPYCLNIRSQVFCSCLGLFQGSAEVQVPFFWRAVQTSPFKELVNMMGCSLHLLCVIW